MMMMQHSGDSASAGDEVGSCADLVAKVFSDISVLERCLVERIRVLESMIISSYASSTSLSKPTHDDDNDVEISDLEDDFKNILERITRLEVGSMEEKREVESRMEEGLTRVSAKLAQASGFRQVLKSKELKMYNCRYGKNSDSRPPTLSSFLPPGGCGDVVGQTPLGLAFPGKISRSKSLLEKSFGQSRFSGQNFDFDSGNSQPLQNLMVKSEFGKFMQIMNSASLLDLKKYVLSCKRDRIRSVPDDSAKFAHRAESVVSLSSPSSPHAQNQLNAFQFHKASSVPHPSEITLDTLVPCPVNDEDDSYWTSSETVEHVTNQQLPLETSFPVSTSASSPDKMANVHKDRGSPCCNGVGLAGRLDPSAYQIYSSSNIISNNVEQFPPNRMSADTSSATVATNAKTHKRTNSLNNNTSSSYFTPNKKPSRKFSVDYSRPKSSVLDSYAFQPPHLLATVEASSTPWRTTKNTPTKFTKYEFARATSELEVKRRESIAGVMYGRPHDCDAVSERHRVGFKISNADGWKPKRKTVNVGKTPEEPRPSSGCVMTSTEYYNSNFLNLSDVPFIDQVQDVRPDKEITTTGVQYSPGENYLSPIVLGAQSDAGIGSVTPRSDGTESKNAEVQKPPQVDEVAPALNGLVWPATAEQVTYRKNAANLRSRWYGFRRAFSVAFERGGASNSSNNNNNNTNCVRKASSTNYLVGRPSGPREEPKKSRSNWEVWKRQSRANLSESFRRKCGWLRVTFKRKRQRIPSAFQDSDAFSRSRFSNDQLDDNSECSPRKPQVVMKSTLDSLTDELLETEKDYVTAMKYVIDHYLPLLNYDSSSKDLAEGLRGRKYVIFGNLEKLHDFHSRRFQESLRMCKGHPYALGSAFLRHDAEFYLYALYSKNKPKSDELMSECGRRFFQIKQLELGDPMDLESYLLKPIQRLSKYALMLKKILQSCPLDRMEYTELETALEMVRFQLRHGEDLLAADCIGGCDVNLQEQGMLIRREDLLVIKGIRRCLRHVFLFEDLVLFTKTKKKQGGQDAYLYKRSLKTTDIGLTENVGEDGRQFEIWFRKRTPENSYRLQAHSKDSKERWTSDITSLLWRQTKNFRHRANANVVMATGLGGNALATAYSDSNTSRPVSFASSSSSSSSSNNSIEHRSTSLSSSSFTRHVSSLSSSSSSAQPISPTELSTSQELSSSAYLRSSYQPSSQTETSSSSRPLTFSGATRTPTKLSVNQLSTAQPPFLTPGFPKLSPVKEQIA